MNATQGSKAGGPARAGASGAAPSRTALLVVTLLATAGLITTAVVMSRPLADDAIIAGDEEANDPIIPQGLLEAFGQASEEQRAKPEETAPKPVATRSAALTGRNSRQVRRAPPQAQIVAIEHAQPPLVEAPPSEAPAPWFEPPNARGVRSATERALKRGTTQTWKAEGQRGYVLISEARTIEGRECRQVSYTRFDAIGQAMSSAREWCRDNGRWRPD